MDGIIIINKPQNFTSHDIVQKVKKITGEKVGHTGTLDPMATGVLPLLIGKATRCSKYLINHDKKYEVQLTLGTKTTTADQEGDILEQKEVPLKIWKEERINTVLKSFLGEQEQLPPMYSAIKIKGKKLYEYARNGESIPIPKRKIKIYQIELLKINEENKQIKFFVHCSKGTYIRSLCEDIAKALGTVGYMSFLKRLQVGNFKLEDSICLKELEENPNEMQKHFITIEDLFQDKATIELETKKLTLFLNGVELTKSLEDGIYRIYQDTKFIGIGTVKNQLLKRDIIL